jgi:Prophage CP4-57 regulatory protein (AlpA)
MPTNFVQDGTETGVRAPKRVLISRWVNEPYPAWDQILTAHDVARLIRRPPWVVRSLAAVGQFPQRQRFRGKKVGWLKVDILEWMARTNRRRVTSSSEKASRRCKPVSPRQQSLPLEHPGAHSLHLHRTQPYIAGVSS